MIIIRWILVKVMKGPRGDKMSHSSYFGHFEGGGGYVWMERAIIFLTLEKYTNIEVKKDE